MPAGGQPPLAPLDLLTNLSGSFAPLLLLGLLLCVLLASTSFVKLSIVFSILRNALGLGQVPSGLVISVLAAILTGYVMLPVARQVATASAPYAAAIDLRSPLAGASAHALWDAYEHGKPPLQAFLARNSGRAEVSLFAELTRNALPEADRASVHDDDISVVLPAFFVTELREALEIGFLVLLPFLVVDLMVSSLLISLGMQALPPAAVSLPFKLLLFVSIDGFRALIRALLTGYQ